MHMLACCRQQTACVYSVGGMTTLVAGLALDRHIASRSAQILSWLCLDRKIPLASRLEYTALLSRMSGLKYLAGGLNPRPVLQAVEHDSPCEWQHDMSHHRYQHVAET